MPRLAALCLIIVAMLALPVSARTRPAPERRESLLWLLASTHTQLTRAGLDTFGPDTVEMLIDIANTPREKGAIRVRALAALGFYDAEASYAFLSSLLNERNLIGNEHGLKMRRQAVRSLGVRFGERALDQPLQMREETEPSLRTSVALALGDTGSLRALPVLELWLTTERELNVRVAVDSAVNKLRGR